MRICRKAGAIESRPGPPYVSGMIGRHRLIGIAFSHYVEKARWVMRRYSVPYTEQRYLPVMHMPAAAWASRGRGRGDRVSSPFSTPILITDRGERICDSSAIVRYVSDRCEGGLYDDPAAAEWEQRFHDRLAPATRRVGYSLSLGNPERMAALLSNVGPTQRAVFRAIEPLAGRVLRDRLKITPEKVERSKQRTFEELEAVEKQLRDGRRYLLGDRFSAADLAFATAISPALCVQPHEGIDVIFPDPATLTGDAAELIARARASRAGQFALRLFAEER